MSEEEEKARKELANSQRLSQQSLLMMNLYNLSALNRDLYTKEQGRYKNFVCLEDDDPEIFKSRLLGVNMLGPSALKSHHFSALIPEVRFFKDYGKEDPVEIVFPTHAGDANNGQRKRYTSNLNTSFADLSAAPPNMGIKGVDWSFKAGVGSHTMDATIMVNVKLYAERISDLFSPVVGIGDSKIRYSDLFTVSEKFSKEKTQSGTMKTNSPSPFRILMQVGWSISPDMEKSFKNEPKYSEVKRALKLMREQKTVLDMHMTLVDFDFDQTGAVHVNISYTSHLLRQMQSGFTSNILFSDEEVARRKSIEREIEKLKEKLKAKKDSLTDEQKETTTEKIKEEEGRLAEEQSDLSETYSSIVSELIKRNKIRVYTVDKENILYRYQYQNVKIDRGLEDFEKECVTPSVPPKQIEGYTYVSVIPIENLPNEYNDQSHVAFLKVYIKKGSTGTAKAYTYHPYANSNAVNDLWRGHKHPDGLITHRELKTLLRKSNEPIFREIESEIAKNSLEKPQCTTRKATGNEKSKMQNELAKSVSPTENESGKAKSLKETFAAISQPEFKSGEYNIKYFYLGDLLEIALDKLRQINPELWKEMRVVVGSTKLSTYTNVEQLFGFYDVSMKDGVVSIMRTPVGDERVRQKSHGKAKRSMKITRDKRDYFRNLADIPIAFSSFLNWFDENYVSKGNLTAPLGKFLKGVSDLAKTSMAAPGTSEEFALVPQQKIVISQLPISVPKELAGTDYFKFNNATGEITDGRYRFNEIRMAAAQKTKRNGMTQESTSRGMSLKESKMKRNIRGKSTNYLILHGLQPSVPPGRILNFVKDNEIGIPHFFIGAESGLLKTLNFVQKPNTSAESNALLKGPSNPPKIPVRGKYDVELTLFGNTFFQPGSVIVINPSALRLGSVADPTSQINALMISGYFNVTSCSSFIQDGNYETKITAQWASAGNGYNLDGKHYTELPTREALDEKTRTKEEK